MVPGGQLGFVGYLVAELHRHLVAPVLEGPFGVLHDVALVHQGDGGPLVIYGVFQGHADQTLAAALGHGLDADGRGGVEGAAHFGIEEMNQFLGLGAGGLPFDPGIDILGVFPEDHHVDQFRRLHGAGHPGVVAHRPDASVKVQDLAQGDVQGAKPPPMGVVSGPLRATRYSRRAVRDSTGR